MAHGPRGADIDPGIKKYILGNATYWFEHELRQYPAVDLDLDALKVHADRIVLMAGRESRGYPAHEVSVELANKLGRELIELPGGHIRAEEHRVGTAGVSRGRCGGVRMN